ncbi:MAG: tRNA pseudouridine synthase B [Alphaproteobacteria bacterium]|nr:MAG: tRNA pseudouridine synthase B [Alphaproteobacteria bacterium]
MTTPEQRRKKGRAISGWVNLDKPLEMGSTQAVGKIRRLFDARKAGHAGTLDPLASGILPIALGEATKTVSFMQEAAKSYEVVVAFGSETTTDDAEGEVMATSDMRPDAASVEAALGHFTGLIEQVPPQFSAIRKDGRRAYDLARAGEKVDLPPRRVQIDKITLLETMNGDQMRLKVECGKGVYIRSLARDLGRFLGGFAHVGALRRTRVGRFDEKTAFGLEKLTALGHSAHDLAALDACLLPLETALDDIPALALSDDAASCIRQGQAMSPPDPQALIGKNGGAVLLTYQGKALAIARMSDEDGLLKPRRVFNL